MPSTATHRRASLTSGDHLDTPVRDVMTPGVVMISEDASLVQVLRALRAHEVHALLVSGARQDKPLGWVTVEGLLGWMGQDPGLATARDVVTEAVRTIDPLAPARDAVAALSSPDTTHLLVCRAAGGAAEGVVSAVNLITLERG